MQGDFKMLGGKVVWGMAQLHYPLPYRIDHIMYNDRLRLKSIKKIDAEGLSDHDVLVAEFYF